MNELFKQLLVELKKLNATIRTPTSYNGPKHYTIEETSSIMGVSENTVRNWIKDGVLAPFQYKGTLRIREISLDRFITKFTG